eukprot:a339756_108.p1 GENE.a339756_108~~a339756_108.p1  ORF type:complete len:410 (+),score=162.32 a339756_108:177-1232(+)
MRAVHRGKPEHTGNMREMHKDKKFMKMLQTPVPKERDIAYIDIKTTNAHAFRKKFEHLDRPVMIRGCAKGWPALKEWEPKRMAKTMGDVEFRVSGTRTKLKHYLRYAAENKDDNPFYLFELDLTGEGREPILDHYTVPKIFHYDYFGVLPERMRPPFRWIVIGPERSGTVMHQDPMGTSAWNTLTHGHKRWIMFPPHIKKSSFHPKNLRTEENLNNVIYWYKDVYPYCVKHAKELEMMECIQAPGETIFVPGDWWHAVINLDMTVAITQNFVSRENFRRVYHRAHHERARMSKRWKKVLDYVAPDLARKANTWSDVESGSDWSTSTSGWTDVDALSTLSSSEVGDFCLKSD